MWARHHNASPADKAAKPRAKERKTVSVKKKFSRRIPAVPGVCLNYSQLRLARREKKQRIQEMVRSQVSVAGRWPMLLQPHREHSVNGSAALNASNFYQHLSILCIFTVIICILLFSYHCILCETKFALPVPEIIQNTRGAEATRRSAVPADWTQPRKLDLPFYFQVAEPGRSAW